MTFSASIQRATTLQVWRGARNPVATSGGADSFSMKYKTPSEAGIARFVLPPKQDRRTGKKPKQVRRYIITKKDRPDLFPQ